MYEQWLADRRRREKLEPTIESYNKDDVDSTRELHDWLEEQRAELETLHGPQPRPVAGRRSAPDARRDRRRGGRAGADRAAARGGPRAARRPRRVAPPRGPPGLVGGLPAQGPGRRGAERRRHGARRAVRAGACGRRSAAKLYEYAFPVQDTKVSGPATRRSTSTPRGRSARSSSWTPLAGSAGAEDGRDRAAAAARAGAGRAAGRQGACARRSRRRGEDVLAGRRLPRAGAARAAGARGTLQLRDGEPPADGDRAARARARRRGAGDPGAAGERQDDRGVRS